MCNFMNTATGLSTLDFWFWGEMDSIIQEKEPDSIEFLKQIANEEAAQMDSEKIRRVCENFGRRVEKCIENRAQRKKRNHIL